VAVASPHVNAVTWNTPFTPTVCVVEGSPAALHTLLGPLPLAEAVDGTAAPSAQARPAATAASW
jgi:hypothetical protein